MFQQNLDKFLSRKNSQLTVIGIPTDEYTCTSNNISHRSPYTPVVNIDFIVEAVMFDTPKMDFEKFKKIIQKAWTDNTTKHTRCIVEGCTPLYYNTVKNNASILVINNDVSTWLRQLRKFRLHTLTDFLEKEHNMDELLKRFSQGKNLKPLDEVSSLFLRKAA